VPVQLDKRQPHLGLELVDTKDGRVLAVRVKPNGAAHA
jgi:hypothetical protein